MRKTYLILCLFSFAVVDSVYAQYFSFDTTALNNAYQSLRSDPESPERQDAFFSAFPGTWTEFFMTYQYFPDEKYDKTMHNLLDSHVDMFEKMADAIDDSLYCFKLFNITVGMMYEPGLTVGFQSMLHNTLPIRKEQMFKIMSLMRRGHVMQFWEFYWSTPEKNKSYEDEYRELLPWVKENWPKYAETMEVSFEYFYDGVNADGSYLKR